MYVLELHQNAQRKKKGKPSVGRHRCYLHCIGLDSQLGHVRVRQRCSAAQRSSGAASRASWRQWVALFLPLCCCALGSRRLADATMAEGRAGLGRGELSGGQAGLSICLCLYFYTRLPSQQPTASLNVPNASLAPKERGACLSSLILGLKWRSTCTK